MKAIKISIILIAFGYITAKYLNLKKEYQQAEKDKVWYCEQYHKLIKRPFKGKIGYTHKDTTVIYDETPSTCPLVNQRLFKD